MAALILLLLSILILSPVLRVHLYARRVVASPIIPSIHPSIHPHPSPRVACPIGRAPGGCFPIIPSIHPSSPPCCVSIWTRAGRSIHPSIHSSILPDLSTASCTLTSPLFALCLLLLTCLSIAWVLQHSRFKKKLPLETLHHINATCHGFCVLRSTRPRRSCLEPLPWGRLAASSRQWRRRHVFIDIRVCRLWHVHPVPHLGCVFQD